ncbi:MAG: tRNA guanosine(34) transglycosylase Tgt, partial [Spirochaetales bacterium]|nr:tRNA guanosine(34) transglycosylase Tgt [Spirochaetales bacterium]
PMLATEHNLNFLYSFVKDIRLHITNGTFSQFKINLLKEYSSKKG